MKNDDLKMCTFDPKHIIISHQGQQPRYNIIIIGLNDEFETTNYFNYQKNLESFLETCRSNSVCKAIFWYCRLLQLVVNNSRIFMQQMI